MTEHSVYVGVDPAGGGFSRGVVIVSPTHEYRPGPTVVEIYGAETPRAMTQLREELEAKGIRNIVEIAAAAAVEDPSKRFSQEWCEQVGERLRVESETNYDWPLALATSKQNCDNPHHATGPNAPFSVSHPEDMYVGRKVPSTRAVSIPASETTCDEPVALTPAPQRAEAKRDPAKPWQPPPERKGWRKKRK